MRIRLFRALCAFALGACLTFAAERPKLVVAIAIDQFRYDYLTRFRSDYHGGLDLLLRDGADFTNARYLQAPTVTAVGHSIFLSGAMPAVSGIVANAWYDRQTKQQVTSVCDWNYKVVGGDQPQHGSKCTDEDPASPKRLLVSTVGDELRNVNDESKVIGISLKARASILPSGHRANLAFWFDISSGNFVTSTFYCDRLPDWASQFDQKSLAATYLDKPWPNFPRWKFRASSESTEKFSKIPASPWGNELVERFAEAAILGEKLGQRGPTDLLTVSFSSNDYVGHAVGPDAPEVRDMSIRVDDQIGKLLQLVDQKVGLKNTIVVLTADHGVAPVPTVNEERNMPGTYIFVDVADLVERALDRSFGEADWVEGGAEDGLYLNWKTLASFQTKDGRHVDVRDVYRAARQAILSTPQVHAVRVYDRDQLENGVAGDMIASAFVNSFFPRRSPDLLIAYEPYAMPGTGHGTTHFSPYGYDTHVPILFMGPGIKAGCYDANVSPIDIAPTLATMLSIETPSGSEGRVLTEMLHNAQ
jgi:predicted AlkP superfamily pyrophosphatase or phosphodiesterase